MSIARRVRKVYEDHPYPAINDLGVDPVWCLPPINWIIDLWQPAAPFPARILSAGCGTGNEVFALRQCFPEAEIVGIDFCASSIATAKRLQQARGLRGIRFAVGDLGEKQVQKRCGGTFDFISCHGVMSYVPRSQVALGNLARLLNPEGALHLGVNGSTHFSMRWRRALTSLGFDPVQMPEDERLRKVVTLFDSLTREDIATEARRERSLLPTDLFGPFIRTSSLREWVEECRHVGLHFLGVYDQNSPFRSTVNNQSYTAFIPRSRAEVAQIVDEACPATFHRMLLAKRATPTPPWQEPRDLAGWRPILARHLRDHQLPERRGAWRGMRKIKIRSPLMNMEIELTTKEWIVEILRQSLGQLSLEDILAKTNGSVRDTTLRKHFYLLHQLYLLNLGSPGGKLENPD